MTRGVKRVLGKRSQLLLLPLGERGYGDPETRFSEDFIQLSRYKRGGFADSRHEPGLMQRYPKPGGLEGIRFDSSQEVGEGGEPFLANRPGIASDTPKNSGSEADYSK
jgi:hypothetical protein